MAGMHNILIDERLFKKVDPEIRKKEIFVFSCLSAMVIILALLSGLSTFVYISIVFKNYLIGGFSAAFITLVMFNLIRLMIITSLNAYHTKLGSYHLDHTIIYDKIKFDKKNEEEDIKIQEAVYDKKENLRNLSMTKGNYKPDTAQRITFLFKVFSLSFLALIFATGIEILIFSAQLNESFADIRTVLANNPDSWVYSKALNPELGNFLIINTHSILLAIDVLYSGLGWIKYLIDAIFILLFIIPIVIIYRSKKVYESSYIKELALHEISISYYHHLHTERYCEILHENIMDFNLEHLIEKQPA